MRFSTSALWTAIAVGLLAACSGNAGVAPVPAVPNAGASSLGLSSLGMSDRDTGHPLGGMTLLPGRDVVVALETSNNKNYVTAVGENRPQPNCGSGMVALHDNATSIGPNESFTPVYEPNSGQYAFEFSDLGIGNYYITAVNGGGIGCPNGAYASSQLYTNATSVGKDEKFTIVWINHNTQVAIQAPSEIAGLTTYVSAFAKCGAAHISNVPFVTYVQNVHRWQKFTLLPEAN